ncbi:MAG: carboxypeptidase M32, partial [Candidatus Thorarchaeota archaeon]
MSKIPQYEKLLALNKESILLGNLNGLAHWDFEVMMPKRGGQQRAEELALLSGILHEKITHPEIGSLIKDVKGHKDFERLSSVQKRNIFLLERNYEKATKIPKEFAQEMTKHSAIATEKWKEAKEKADYSIFRDALEKMVELKKKQAHYFNPDGDPLDVLIDNYEKGFSKDLFDKIFNEVKSELVPLIKKCLESPIQPDMSLIYRECSIEIQRKLIADSVKQVHYDLDKGRIDEAVHPFSTGYFDDVRITVKYYPNDFTAAFYGGMHESGHGLYEQNFPVDFKYQPLGSSSSSAMHEGQARFIENIIGRSEEFWEFYLPRFKEITGKIFADVELQPFVHAINQVSATKIRIHADPVTYSLHIIVRYEIEKELFEEKISIDELPQVWDQKMKDYLGVEIKNDSEGLVQDTHWAWA